MAKPQIIVLPGAWHSPPYMATVTAKLQDAGYTVHARQLPAVGNPNPPKDLSEDIAFVRSMVDDAIGSGNDVVVVAHSWGGLIAGSALIGLGKKEREAEGKKGGVVRVGYMAAVIAPEGVSLMEVIQQLPGWIDVKTPYLYANDTQIFYSDLPEFEQKEWFSKLQTHSEATFYAPATGASWKEIPTSYLLCEDDLAIPVGGQEACINGVKEAGLEVDVTRIKSGHSPFLSKPDETAEWIRKVAGEKV